MMEHDLTNWGDGLTRTLGLISGWRGFGRNGVARPLSGVKCDNIKHSQQTQQPGECRKGAIIIDVKSTGAVDLAACHP